MANRLFLGILAAALTAGSLVARAAEPVQLKFAFPAPIQSKVNVWGIDPWIKEVEKASGGTLQIKLFAGPTLGNFQNIYERTITGVTDISFGIFGPLAGQFKKVFVAGLPFEAKNCSEAGLALWRLYHNGLLSDEFGKVKVLALFTFPSAGFHTNKPIKTAADLKGLKIMASDRAIAELASVLGASPIVMTPPDFYLAMNRGVADGISVGWSAVTTFKLDEVTKYHLDASTGLLPAYVLMNKNAYARLPDKAKQAIDRYSGEPFFVAMGKVTDRMDKAGREMVEAEQGQTVTDLSPAESERWKTLSQPIVQNWVKNTPNGAKILAAFREEIRNIRSRR